ncbi:hypothetical protein BAUCODRAFT_30240 [Baudoinia panamericana UAMH 10762]|uniref:Uncharacterized protein n=1 Tax=Baudoinia panamericana (strain UAMH 10762) TaxID=717646 RepID=M2MSH4_BAUPA|nr:uncharacterized protein BAUCODRAFT_30240 [Baudoinia panamericana UAMH 10762]EMC99826.1 hypothetical protein BAUCODRAFT_30240 [Baudoinia panamericana UAMH 10762]
MHRLTDEVVSKPDDCGSCTLPIAMCPGTTGQDQIGHEYSRGETRQTPSPYPKDSRIAGTHTCELNQEGRSGNRAAILSMTRQHDLEPNPRHPLLAEQGDYMTV